MFSFVALLVSFISIYEIVFIVYVISYLIDRNFMSVVDRVFGKKVECKDNFSVSLKKGRFEKIEFFNIIQNSEPI